MQGKNDAYQNQTNRSADTLSLWEVAFTAGLHFQFKDSGVQELAPGEIALLVRNPEAFALRYGAGLPVAGNFGEFKLSDSGENLRLSLTDGTVLLDLRYNDKDPWPVEADGDGPSLTLIDPSSTNGTEPVEWMASSKTGGTPGRLESTDPGEVDRDGDGLSAFLEEALGTSDADPSSGPASVTLRQERIEGGGTPGVFWTFETSRNPEVQGVVFTLEYSSDLKTWIPADPLFEIAPGEEPAADVLQWRSREPAGAMEAAALFLRLRVSRE